MEGVSVITVSHPHRTPLTASVRLADVSNATARTPAATPQLQVSDLHKTYHRGSVAVPVLRGVDLSIHEGELVSIVGQSGSGKSTLLHLMAGLDKADRGEVRYQGRDLQQLRTRVRERLRNREFGMVFQFYHLLPELTALENILLPEWIGLGWKSCFRAPRESRERALALLEWVGVAKRARHRPRELSGGEMQRVAIARALMVLPKVLLADEPTGNLDRKTGSDILQLLCDLNKDSGLTIVLVTHDLAVAERAHRTVRLTEGRVDET